MDDVFPRPCYTPPSSSICTTNNSNPATSQCWVNVNIEMNGRSAREVLDRKKGTNEHELKISVKVQNRRRILSELIRTLIAFLLLLFAFFLNFCVLAVIHDIVPRKPLNDLVFYFIPQQRWAWTANDILCVGSTINGFVFLSLHQQRLLVFRRLFLIAAILYGLRAVLLSFTFLPPSFPNVDEICLPQVRILSPGYHLVLLNRLFDYFSSLGLTELTFNNGKILCGDSMFSGHSLFLTVMYFTNIRYTPKHMRLLRYIPMAISFTGMASLILSRAHYSIDVLIAYWLTSHVFTSYHQQFEIVPRSRINEYSRLWWFRICYWFEKGSPEGLIHNEWNCPLLCRIPDMPFRACI